MKRIFLFVTAASIIGIPAFANTVVTSQTYVDSADALKQDKITAGIVYAKQSKKVCVRWLDNAEQTDANCLLWNLPD